MATVVLCCSAAAVLLLTSASPFSSTLDFMAFYVFQNLPLCLNFPSLPPPLSSFSFTILLFSAIFLFFCNSFPHPSSLSSQVSECNWPSRQAPSLHNLFAVCKNMHNWLKQNPKNVCVITCSVRRCSHIALSSYSSLSSM